MKTSNVVLAIVLALCGVVTIVAILAGLFYFGRRGISSRPPTDAEKRLILSAASFEELGQTLDPKCLKTVSKLHLDATREIELRYDCGEGSAVFIVSQAENVRSVREARENFAQSIGAYKTGLAIGGATVEPRPELLTLGDQQYAALVRRGTYVIGSVFVVRQGHVLHALVTTGIYFDDPVVVHDLFAPLFEESKKQFGT